METNVDNILPFTNADGRVEQMISKWNISGKLLFLLSSSVQMSAKKSGGVMSGELMSGLNFWEFSFSTHISQMAFIKLKPRWIFLVQKPHREKWCMPFAFAVRWEHIPPFSSWTEGCSRKQFKTFSSFFGRFSNHLYFDL